MARPREFDEQAVLDAATDWFWKNGYEATSVRDLADRMGMTTASLYNAFGDKRALYRLVLDRYASVALRRCADALGGNMPPLRGIEHFFNTIVEDALNDRLHKGCLVVNTSLEVAPHDADFREVVKQVFVRIEKYMRDCISAGQLEGVISAKQPADDLARLLLGALLGIRVLSRTRPDAELLTGLVRPLFLLLQSEKVVAG